jgi:predicted MFS family arabinose efflux permease
LTLAASLRLWLNTARRFAYPFAPALARGLGVPLTAVTSVIAVNQATCLFGLVFGPLADRYGPRLIMLLGLTLLGAGMLAAGFLPFYGFVMVGLFLAGVGKNLFDPALQAYIGRRVPYDRRGLAVGLVEISWAAAALIGIPVMGLLIERVSWRAPFFALGGLGLLGAALIGLFFSGDGRPAASAARRSWWRVWSELAGHRPARGVLAVIFFVSAANDNLFVVYGAWLEGAFALSAVALGLATTSIGAAELIGEFLTAGLSDRIGLYRAVIWGLTLSAAAYLLLPWTASGLPWAAAGLFAVFLFVEFTIVTLLSLATEVTPESRATMMAGFALAAGAGRVVGALLGGQVWLAGGMPAVAAVSAAGSLAAAFCLWRDLRFWRT